MNNPIAWMVAEMVFTIEESAIEMAKVYGDEVIPLYTHPVKELTLTDEKILEIADKCGLVDYRPAERKLYSQFDKGELENFAKAILRKAQEK